MRVRLPDGRERTLLGTVKGIGDRIETPDLGDLVVTGFEGETALAKPVGPPPERVAKPWIKPVPRPGGAGVA